MTQKFKFELGRVENIVEKGENAGYQHFLLYPQCPLKASISRLLKVGIVWYRVECCKKMASSCFQGIERKCLSNFNRGQSTHAK